MLDNLKLQISVLPKEPDFTFKVGGGQEVKVSAKEARYIADSIYDALGIVLEIEGEEENPPPSFADLWLNPALEN